MRYRLLRLTEIVACYILSNAMRYGPKRYEDWFVEKYFQIGNGLRQKRFNVPMADCASCGLLYPNDDLSLVTKRDGRLGLECVECQNFTSLVRAVFDWEAA